MKESIKKKIKSNIKLGYKYNGKFIPMDDSNADYHQMQLDEENKDINKNAVQPGSILYRQGFFEIVLISGTGKITTASLSGGAIQSQYPKGRIRWYDSIDELLDGRDYWLVTPKLIGMKKVNSK